MGALSLPDNIIYEERIERLCCTARIGLAAFYGNIKDKFPYTAYLKENERWVLKGESIRYAAIAQIGIAKWLKYHPDDKEQLPDLWPTVTDRLGGIDLIGDLALALWAGLETGADNCRSFAEVLAECWNEQEKICNSVELGWVLMAATLAMRSKENLEPIIQPLLKEAHRKLSSLYNSQSGLFQRHNRKGFAEVLHRRVACFADQVYPILAMATYGTNYNDNESIEMAARAVETICCFQGELGQWQWHYDILGNKLCEEYPVFSVHQDSMAPMAILASDKASSSDHTKEIELGMRWLFGENELKENLVLEDKGIVWRDIERKEPSKFSRTTRGLCCVLGADRIHKSMANCFRHFVVNPECRPYHLGWILYAWADYTDNK